MDIHILELMLGKRFEIERLVKLNGLTAEWQNGKDKFCDRLFKHRLEETFLLVDSRIEKAKEIYWDYLHIVYGTMKPKFRWTIRHYYDV